MAQNDRSCVENIVRGPESVTPATKMDRHCVYEWRCCLLAFEKKQQPQEKNANGPPKTVKPIKTAPTPVRQLQNRHYGVHQQDSEFSALRHLNIVAVDPGAVDLISAVRLHNTEEALRQLAAPPVEFTDETYKQRRRRLLSERMFELKRSTFTLSNKEWQAKTGKLLNRQRLLVLSKAKNMEATYLRLAESSSRSGYADVYVLHVQARIETSASIASVNKSQDAPSLEVPSVPKRTTCCHQTSHVSFGWFESCRHDRCVGQRGIRSNIARPRACTKQKAAVLPGQARAARRWFRASVFDYERVPSRNSRPYLQQTVSGSSSHCCQVPGLLHHTES